tara:strand:- start:496690 stop:498039 length:1350 start_codon:yes stop_codon:yes gene_type:complete
MFKKLLLTLLLISSFAHAQFTVTGELEPTAEYPWMILYQLKGAKPKYIAYDSIKNGTFSIKIPTKTAPGVYRLVYDIKNELFVDFINSNEDVSLKFNPKNPTTSVVFTRSEDNKIYHSYLRAAAVPQQQLDSIQVAYFKEIDAAKEQELRNEYVKWHQNLNSIQKDYEAKAENRVAAHFIKASARYNAEKPIKLPADYLETVQNHFFDNVAFNNQVLLNSTFIYDKINDFIFYLNTSEDPDEKVKLRKEAITIVIAKIGSNAILAKDIEESLLHTFAQEEDITMVNFMLNNYLQLPKELQDVAFVNEIKAQLKTAVGMVVPTIAWEENGIKKDLLNLTGYKNYVVVFWSSTCSHCLKEMPILYDYLKDNTTTKVIAVGLEDNQSEVIWQNMITHYKNFIHVYGDHKWKNELAREYGVNATPSFFVLDAKKKVVAKPDDVEALKIYFAQK